MVFKYSKFKKKLIPSKYGNIRWRVGVEDNTVFRGTMSERWLTFSTTAMEVRSNIIEVERNGLYVCIADKIFSQMQTKQKFYKKNRNRETLKACRFALQ